MKLVRDLLVIAAVCAGFYAWRHRPQPVRPPLIPGPAPTLAMPAPSGRTPRPEDGGQMLVEKDSLGAREVHAPGQRARPKTLGETPQLLSGESAPSLDDSAAPPPPDPVETWLDRAATPKGMATVFALFVLCYLLLGRALRKGPGGHGLTHT